MSPYSNDNGPESKPESMLGAWIAIGTGGGVALGLVFDNIALGIAIGACLGVAIGISVDRNRGVEPSQMTGDKRRALLLTFGLGVLVLLIVVAALWLLRTN